MASVQPGSLLGQLSQYLLFLESLRGPFDQKPGRTLPGSAWRCVLIPPLVYTLFFNLARGSAFRGHLTLGHGMAYPFF